MPKLLFYRQKRYDGGVRTGVELDDQTIAERYEGGAAASDPTLLWYVDLRCDGAGILEDPDAAGHWLLDQTSVIRERFGRSAERLRAGADTDIDSLTWSEFEDVPESVTMTIACSAARRIDARQMAANLDEVGQNWDAIIRSLDIPQVVEDLR